jgi:hypothetical protein
MEIIGKNYRIIYDPTNTTINFQGILRLYGAAGYVSLDDFKKSRTSDKTSQRQNGSAVYSSLMEMFNEILKQQPTTVTLNLRELQALNSSGINVLSKFVIKVRDHKASQLIVQSTRQFPWQRKLLKNLQKLMPDLMVEWE